MRSTNKEKILQESIHLFNTHGIVNISTNHICKHLKISPGNLYFHYRNKEEILFQLFSRMCDETYALWSAEFSKADFLPPMEFIERSLEIFWKYRFFHREMYTVRRQDPRLNSLWHKHIEKTRRFMKAAYAKWVRNNLMNAIDSAEKLRVVSDILLVTASSFFQFYESIEKPATNRPLQMARQYLFHFLHPYLTKEYAEKQR